MAKQISHLVQIRNEKNRDLSLPKQVENFRLYMIDRNLSERTIISYMENLKLFFKFLKIEKNSRADKSILLDAKKFNETYVNLEPVGITFIRNITTDNLTEYFRFSTDILRNSPSTKNTKIVIIKAFFKYLLIQEECVDKNVSEKIELPKLGRKDLVYMNLNEIKKILTLVKNQVGNNTVTNKRNFLVMSLFLNNGLRKSELQGIDLKDIFLDEDYINVKGKGNKARKVFLNQMVHKSLKDYLIERDTICNDINDKDKEALFISEKFNRISCSAIDNLVNKYVCKAGITKPISVHSLRKSFAMMQYKSGCDLKTLQELMSHSSMNTIQSYIRSDEESMRKAIDNNPLADMII